MTTRPQRLNDYTCSDFEVQLRRISVLVRGEGSGIHKVGDARGRSIAIGGQMGGESGKMWCEGGNILPNGLPLALRSLPRVFSQKFLQQLKTTLFGRAGVGSASE